MPKTKTMAAPVMAGMKEGVMAREMMAEVLTAGAVIAEEVMAGVMMAGKVMVEDVKWES